MGDKHGPDEAAIRAIERPHPNLLVMYFLQGCAVLFAFPIVESPLTDEVFRLAVDLYRSARRAGFTVRSSVDCLIAACALRSSLTVLHHDRDFDALARVSTLDVRRI